jgi:alkylation response protein AidB-like acyl-CoA dehydrogenase
VDFRLTEEQEALRRGMRELLAARFGREALRAAVDSAEAETGPTLDTALWGELGETGLFSLRAPESAGGAGLGLPEAVLVFEEAGRALLPGPLAASHLAGSWGLVPGAADGSVVVTGTGVVRAAADVGAGLDGASTVAPLVEHLEAAGAVLVLGDGDGDGDGDGGAVGEEDTVGEEGGGGGVRVVAPRQLVAESVRSVDPLSPLHRVLGWSAPGADIGRPPQVDVAALQREATLLTAAQQLGSAWRTLELAVGHARRREQFGRPIGAFQAVQHLCAGMLVRSETARSVVYAAAVTEDEEEICAAKLLADSAAVDNARDCLQVYGGMGFTWDADVHLHLKRAWLRAQQWRTAVTSEEQLASALLRTMCR